MAPRQLSIDKRLAGMCAYCGAKPDTSDHVPSKVLLDKPFPRDLPVVNACKKCNESFSKDEEYLSCFIECVVCGSTEPSGLQRQKIKHTLGKRPKLKARIAASQDVGAAESLLWKPEIDRIRNVVTKLAQGHVAYKKYPLSDEPDSVSFAPLSVLSANDRFVFEDVTSCDLPRWPEIGSRAFHRALHKRTKRLEMTSGWDIVQRGRYRYSVVESDGMIVKIVLREYLACVAVWNDI